MIDDDTKRALELAGRMANAAIIVAGGSDITTGRHYDSVSLINASAACAELRRCLHDYNEHMIEMMLKKNKKNKSDGRASEES